MPAIGSNLFFQLGQVVRTLFQNLFVVSLEPTCLCSSPRQEHCWNKDLSRLTAAITPVTAHHWGELLR